MPTNQAIDAALKALNADEVRVLDAPTLNEVRLPLAAGERALFDRAVELRRGFDDLHDRVLRSAAFAEASLGTAAFIHELRQCLSPLIGLAELLKETPDSPYVGEWVGEISGQAQRIADLLDRHAALLRNHASDEEPCELGPVVAEAARYFSRLPPGVKLVTEVAAETPRAITKRRQLLHALINLLANARDAQKGKPGTIRVSARTVGGPNGAAVELVISDQGAGVDPAIRERIFEPLFTTKQEEGTGLGLYLSRELLRPHGELRLAEEGELPEGTKTAFVIRLPQEGSLPKKAAPSAEQLQEVARAQAADLDPWSDAKGRAFTQLEPVVREERNHPVLLVEDEPAVRRMTRAVLESVANIKIYEAADAAFALKLLEKVKVDFLVCDKNLPDSDGLEVIRSARKQYPGIDAMIVTGYPSPDSAAEAIRVGATDYLLKPVREVKTLRESVSSALSRQKLQRIAERCERLLIELGRDLLAKAPEHSPARIAIAAMLSSFEPTPDTATIRCAALGSVEVAELRGVEVHRLAKPEDLVEHPSALDLVLFSAEVAPETARGLVAAAKKRTAPPHLLPIGRFLHTETAVAAIQGRTGVVVEPNASPMDLSEAVKFAATRRRREVRAESLRGFLKELGLSL